MDSFNDREQAFEAQHRHELELKFRTLSRRAKMFGIWIGERIGLPVEESYALGKEMSRMQFETAGIGQLLDLAEARLAQAEKPLPRHALETQLEHLGVKAREQILGEDSRERYVQGN